MKKFYSLLLFGLLFNIGFSQESICEKFKTGKFLYTSEGLPDITVTRTKTTQTETIKDQQKSFKAPSFGNQIVLMNLYLRKALSKSL